MPPILAKVIVLSAGFVGLRGVQAGVEKILVCLMVLTAPIQKPAPLSIVLGQ